MGDDERPKRDLVLLQGPTPDGAGLRVIRAKGDQIEAGEVRALEEGKPVYGEVVTLKPREETPWVCDVKVEHAVEAPRAASAGPSKKGPAQVATEAYRDHYDRVFGEKPTPGRRREELN